MDRNGDVCVMCVQWNGPNDTADARKVLSVECMYCTFISIIIFFLFCYFYFENVFVYAYRMRLFEQCEQCEH